MTPNALNKICAHPVGVSWVFGACALDAIVVFVLSKEETLTAIVSDWQVASFLALGLVPATLLGYFVGMFTCWPLIRPVCSRINGAPFKVGDRVMILSGPMRGGTAEVEDITIGQGGWDVVWLALGPEHEKKFSNIFEEYSLLKIQKCEQDGAANGSQPIRSETNQASPAAGSRR